MPTTKPRARKVPLQGDAPWFTDARFGLFIHWGLYSLLARHEWVKSRERIPDADYQTYFDHFNPDLYDPAAWAQAARQAGMKYFVITTKHHEGFCLWNTRHTDYKVTNTPYKRDVLTPLVNAFRDEGLRVGFYHSLLDWHHPHYPLDSCHPMRDDPHAQQTNKNRDIRIYARYLHAQVKELLTQFGRIDYLWPDFSIRNPQTGGMEKGRDAWQSQKLVRLIRTLQPHILINDRLDLLDVPGGWDVRSPEQVMVRRPPTLDGKPVLWETCQTFSGSWGYHRDESTFKSVEQLLLLLIDTVSKGGNLLLNVGPTARGQFDDRALDRLAGIGRWMQHHSRAIYGCTTAPAPFQTPQDCRLTYNPKTNRIYVHVLTWPIGRIHLDGFAGNVTHAQLLHDASELLPLKPLPPPHQWDQPDPRTLTLAMPIEKPHTPVPVIELFLK